MYAPADISYTHKIYPRARYIPEQRYILVTDISQPTMAQNYSISEKTLKTNPNPPLLVVLLVNNEKVWP